MYKVSRGIQSVWSIDGYEVPKKYEDPNQIIKHRELMEAIKKGQKDRKTVTRRGNYLDDLKKVMTAPGPGAYEVVKKWPEAKVKGQRAKHITAKNSYIDLINIQAKKDKAPGPGAYNLLVSVEETMKLAEKNRKITSRLRF